MSRLSQVSMRRRSRWHPMPGRSSRVYRRSIIIRSMALRRTTVLADLRKRLSVIQDAYVLTIPPPPVQGIGNAGGFKMMLRGPCRAWFGRARARRADPCRRRQQGSGLRRRLHAVQYAGSPSIYTDIDREKAEKVGLTPTDVFSTLQVYLGSQYVNRLQLSWQNLRSHSAGRWQL